MSKKKQAQKLMSEYSELIQRMQNRRTNQKNFRIVELNDQSDLSVDIELDSGLSILILNDQDAIPFQEVTRSANDQAAIDDLGGSG